jgi:hypothetical protein
MAAAIGRVTPLAFTKLFMLFEVFPAQYTACDRGTKFFLFRDVQSHHGSIVVPPFWTTMNEETLTIVV